MSLISNRQNLFVVHVISQNYHTDLECVYSLRSMFDKHTKHRVIQVHRHLKYLFQPVPNISHASVAMVA